MERAVKPFTVGARRTTIRDVARAADVSPAAVSQALNAPARLRPATVERIVSVARDLGYAPNPHARALHSRRIGVIGVLVPQSIERIFANPFFAMFFSGVGMTTDQLGIGLLAVSPIGTSLQRALAAAPVDGFVIVGLNEDHEEVAPLRARGVPFVIVDGDATHASSVNAEDELGTYASAAYLLDRGHRDVCVLGFEPPAAHLGDPPYGVGWRRQRGVMRAFVDRGLRWSDGLLVPTPATFAGGEATFGRLLDSGRRPTAVLAVSDAMAIGALRAADARGVRVPEDLEVVGFDDIPQASLTRPALSTVRQPIVEKGRRAAQLLIAGIEEGGPAQRVLLPAELVLRDTTRSGKGEKEGHHGVPASDRTERGNQQ